MAADVVAPSTYNWNGPYVGLEGTYGWASSTHCNSFCSGAPSNPVVYGSGLGGGAEVGFNYILSNVLIGAEADYSLMGLNGSSPGGGGFGCGGGNGCVTNVTGIGTARLRLGVPVNNVLPYVTAGGALSSITASLGSNPPGNTNFLNFAAGAGIEVGLSHHLSVKAEYLHIFDNGQLFIYPSGCGGPGCGVEHYSADLARVGINLHF